MFVYVGHGLTLHSVQEFQMCCYAYVEWHGRSQSRKKKKKTTLKNLKVTELEVSEHKTITPDPNTYMIKTSKWVYGL